MNRKNLISNIKTLLKSIDSDEEYFLISKNRYSYLSPSRKGSDWIDFIYVYKGIFSLWKPRVKVKWIYVKPSVRKVSFSTLDTLRSKEHSFSNDISLFTNDSLILLKSDLESFLSK